MSLKGRLKRFEAARRRQGDEPYDMVGPIPPRELDYLAVIEEYLHLKDSMSAEPTNQWLGGAPVVRERIPEKVLGPDYTRRELCELAVSRALESRGYSEDEIDDATPEEFVALLEEEWDRRGESRAEADEEPR